MKFVLEVDLDLPKWPVYDDMRDIESPIEEVARELGGKVITVRWAEVDEHPPRFSRARESKPMVVGEQLILDREYRTVDL